MTPRVPAQPSPADLEEFRAAERDELARRWRIVAPVAAAIVLLAEAASRLSQEFPPTPRLTLAVLALLLGIWMASRRGASRGTLGALSILATVAGAVLVSTTCALSGGFDSVHVMAIPVVFGLQATLLSLTWGEVTVANALAIATWLSVNALHPAARGDATGLAVSGTFLVASAAVTALAVRMQRDLRLREFLLRRSVERGLRFAVHDVLYRHLPPAYVERVLQGTHLMDGPPERRVVTIVFADIVAFSSLTEELAPDELAKVMAAFYDATSTIAFEMGTTIDKFIGDAVMAFIGAPETLSRREQSRRALELAIAWQRAVASLAPGRPGQALKLRIAVHQDSVIVGSFGGRRRTDYTVLGMGVNVASRLESLCPPGAILFSQAAFDQLEPRPEATAMPDLVLRGMPRRVSAYCIVPDAPTVTAPRATDAAAAH